ncbi:hypothetical protein GCM10007385_08230 [Tateyamaria omphalii]|uniref:hypothetical protein n=1 Tax=Tateyamaria omphalii TaxID=299262 RepID=UPI00167AFF6B|nr:hypothetical protein [Tateyamaria omphalii]GGX42818.1 hypothetical protein GCM10007385_08230 [Tateyamaria omphalii]
MTPIQRTLLAIAAFIAVAVGTFIYFIANWDASKAEPIGVLRERSPFILPNKLRGLGQSPSPALSVRTTA